MPRSPKAQRPKLSLQETYRSLVDSIRSALDGITSPKAPKAPANGQLTPPDEKMDIDMLCKNPAADITQLAGKLPSCDINENIDPLPIAEAALIRLQLMDSTMLTEDSLWRDIYAFTGTTRTFNGTDLIQSIWKERTAIHKPYDFKIAPQGGVSIARPMPGLSWIQVKFTFRTQGTPKTTCIGLMRLVPDENEDWKIWLLTTILQGLDGFPNVDTLEPAMDWEMEQPPTPVSDSGAPEVQNCVIIGAGMAGLCVAGYMKALGFDAVILEKKDSIGQTWAERYDSVSIHTSKAAGQLPFEPVWGPEYPYHLGVKHLVEGYTKWVKKYQIDVWLSTELIKAYWNEKDNTWTLAIKQHGVQREIRTRHLVMALGLCSLKHMPEFPNREAFKGPVMHAEEYKRAKQWKGLKGVVVGAANSGHDISNDMLQSGLGSVTMVQRGATPVLPVEYWSRIYDGVYNDKMPVHVSDTMMVSTPNAITRLMAMKAIQKFASQEPERFDALERAGFKVIRYMDMYHSLLVRFGSHYIDVGVSKKIADGSIKVKSDALITSFNESGLTFSDGSTLEADVIVFATGYQGNMRVLASNLVEDNVAEKLHDYWGVDDEGEIRGAWKPIGHPNIWYTGGNVLYMRYFAKFLAMSLAADIKGSPLPLYEKLY